MSYVLVDEKEVKQIQDAYLQQAQDLSRAAKMLESQNEEMAKANSLLNQQGETIQQLVDTLKSTKEDNKNMHVLITAMVQSAGGEIIVRIADYNDCMEGKHVLSRRDGVVEGDAVFMTRELPSSPLWLTKNQVMQ